MRVFVPGNDVRSPGLRWTRSVSPLLYRTRIDASFVTFRIEPVKPYCELADRSRGQMLIQTGPG
jgi:hypothetical protein